MSASALMSLGTRALAANYAALQSTGNNIANVNTPGYSRQSVVLETAGGQFTGAGFFGKGVLVSTIERAHSDYLKNEAATSTALAAADEARSSNLQNLENVFKTGESGLGYAAGQLFNAFADVANKPQDASARLVVLARADEMASSFSAAAQQVETIQSGVAQDLKVAIKSVNSLTTQIAGLNQKIAAAQGSGHQPNDLLDQREQAINQLSQFIQVTTIPADDGTTSVFLGGGQSIVLGAVSTNLAPVPDEFNPSRMQVGLDATHGVRTLPDELLSGGSIAGLLQFQNSDLARARDQLGQMAAAIAGAVNTQQSLGIDLGQPAGPGAPIFSTGPVGVAPSSKNALGPGGVPVASTVDAAGNRVPTVSAAVVNAAQLSDSDYELSATSAGTYQLKRLSDNTTRTVANGDVVDGFQINITTPAPVAGDRFLLRPVSAAAINMQRVLTDPKGIAAASPVIATVAGANTGTMSVGSLRAASPALNPNLTATFTFTDNAGGYNYSLVDSTGALPTTNGSGTWTAGQPILLNGFELQLSGVPRAGDALTVQKTAFTSTDNGNANAMIGLRDAAMIGQTTLANGTVVPGDTVTDAYANMLADIGVRVQGAKLAATQSASVASDAKKAVSAKSGVNLDEEAARLIQYQQSYQAAGKMLQIAQSIFETLLQVAG